MAIAGWSVVLACGVFGCKRQVGPVVARVGGETITLSDINERLKATPPAYQPYAQSEQGRKEFVDLLVREKVLLEEARKAGFAREAAYRQAVREFKAQQVRRLKEFEDTLLIESYLRKLRTTELSATDTDVQAYFDAHRADFDIPLEIQVAHILVGSQEDAGRAMDRVKKGEAFEKVAAEMSKDAASAAKGGKLSPFRHGMLMPEFEAAAFPLSLGQVSAPIQTQFGFHIIKKLSERKLPARKLADAKEDIRRRLERAKFDAWVSSKEKAAGVKIDEKALSQLSVKAAEETQ